jgi:hypothetical protein
VKSSTALGMSSADAEVYAALARCFEVGDRTAFERLHTA